MVPRAFATVAAVLPVLAAFWPLFSYDDDQYASDAVTVVSLFDQPGDLLFLLIPSLAIMVLAAGTWIGTPQRLWGVWAVLSAATIRYGLDRIVEDMKITWSGVDDQGRPAGGASFGQVDVGGVLLYCACGLIAIAGIVAFINTYRRPVG